MKKLLPLLLAAFMILSLTSCDLSGLENLMGSDDGERVELNYDYEQMQANLADIRQQQGLLIEMTVVAMETGEMPESERIAYAQTANSFYYCGDGTEIMFDFSDQSKCVTYEKQEDGTWIKYDTVYEESGLTREHMEQAASLYTTALTGYLGNYAQFAGQMMKVTEETVAGRECDKFTYSLMLLGYGVEYVFCVDRETGMCLKWEMSAAAGMEGSASVEYTCTAFETPYTVTFPADAVDVTGQSDASDG